MQQKPGEGGEEQGRGRSCEERRKKGEKKEDDKNQARTWSEVGRKRASEKWEAWTRGWAEEPAGHVDSSTGLRRPLDGRVLIHLSTRNQRIVVKKKKGTSVIVLTA